MLSRIPPRNPFRHASNKKRPTDMTLPEKAVFGVLLTSMATGMYQIIAGPWGEDGTKKNESGMNQNHQNIAVSNKELINTKEPTEKTWTSM